MYKAVIFDCFGVLITDALGAIVAELTVKNPEAAAQVLSLVNASSKGILTREESTRLVAEILGITPDAYRAKVKDGEVKNRQLFELILTLRASYKTAMLSNISSGGLSHRFTTNELNRYFDAVVASGEIGYVKPEPEAYTITADRLGVKVSECIFIDDREDYCVGARRVGMAAHVYHPSHDLRKTLKNDFKLQLN